MNIVCITRKNFVPLFLDYKQRYRYMHLLNFATSFPDESSCKLKWKESAINRGSFALIAGVRNIIGNRTRNATNARNVTIVKV
jgi:hypothetical protein